MMKAVLISFTVLLFVESFAGGKDCAPLLNIEVPSAFSESVESLSVERPDGTGRFIELGNQLIETNELGVEDLKLFIEKSNENNSIANPIQNSNGMSTRQLFNYKLFQDYIDGSMLQNEVLLNWAQDNLQEMSQTQVKRSEVKKNTSSFARPLIFHTIPKGSFRRDYGNEVTLDQNIEVSATPITQFQWADVMTENPSYYTDGNDTIEGVNPVGTPVLDGWVEVRGGSYSNLNRLMVRTHDELRGRINNSHSSFETGFRLVRSLPEGSE